jgi:hypothetical protein
MDIIITKIFYLIIIYIIFNNQFPDHDRAHDAYMQAAG